MKSAKALEGTVKPVKEVERMIKKELTQMNGLPTKSTQDASNRRAARAGIWLRYFFNILIMRTVGGLIAGVFVSQRPLPAHTATPAQEDYDTAEADDLEGNRNEANEADETEVLPDQASISAEEAMAAAEAANPGAKALEVELENENGVLVYEVEMDDGLEVMVDAANGNILGTEAENVD